MRTLLAPGPGPRNRPPASTPLKLLAGTTCPASQPRLVFARIDPAPAEGAFAPGTVDDNGFPLHLQYTIQGEDAVGHTTYPGVAELDSTRETIVEFGPGCHWLNYPGEIALVGGAGLWVVDIQVVPATERHLHWHYLLQRVEVGDTFTMPSGHSVVGTFNPAATLAMFDDYELVVGAPPVPAFGAITVNTTGSSDDELWVYTGWYG